MTIPAIIGGIYHIWLMVLTILKDMKVNGKDYPNIILWKNVPNTNQIYKVYG